MAPVPCGSDAGSFEIRNGTNGKELWFKGGADFESKSSYAVTVNADDVSAANHAASGHDASKNFSLTIIDGNDAPSGVLLSHAVTAVAENGAALKISDLSVSDDALGTNTLTLTGPDAGAFEI